MQRLPTSRTRFGPDIVAEFMPPEQPSSKVLIMTTGCPGYPGGKEEVMDFYARRGYWVIIPRYRGTWESGGSFLEYAPSEDVVTVMDHLGAFEDLWSGAKHSIHDPEVYLIGGSFGGPAAILASRDTRVKKAATISAVTDWTDQEHTAEPLDVMSAYLPAAFGMTYRGEPNAYLKLAKGDFYNPMHEKETIDGTKLLLIHAKDDRVVHPGPAEVFARETGAAIVLLPSGGHMGAGKAALPQIARHIERHFKGKERKGFPFIKAS